MKVNSTVKLNMARINHLSQTAVTALEMTAEELHTEIVQAQVMPRDTGTMQNESTFVDCSESANGKVSIVTSTPYARRLFYHPEYNFQKDKNPNAKGRWFEDWMKGGKYADFAAKTFRNLFKRLGGV